MVPSIKVDSFGIILFILGGIKMADFRRVIVLSPYQILEHEEDYVEDLSHSHEEILHQMLSDETWNEYSTFLEQKMYPEATWYYGVPVNTRASYIAFHIGFSVIYESESISFVFLSNFITEQHQEYLKEHFKESQERILCYMTYFTDNGLLQFEKCDSSEFENVPPTVAYQEVYKKLEAAILHHQKKGVEEREKGNVR